MRSCASLQSTQKQAQANCMARCNECFITTVGSVNNDPQAAVPFHVAYADSSYRFDTTGLNIKW